MSMLRESFVAMLCLLVLGLKTVPAYADGGSSDISIEVQENVRRLLHRARELGWEEINGVKVADLESQVRSVAAWSITEGGKVRFGGRETAHFEVSKLGVAVFYNPGARDEIPAGQMPYFDAHEVIGALVPGEEEKYYGITARLREIVERKIARSALKPHENYLKMKSWAPNGLKQPINPFAFSNGGITKVGGGGDWNELELKSLVLARIESWLELKNATVDSNSFKTYVACARIRVGKFTRPYEVNAFGQGVSSLVHSDRYEINLSRSLWRAADHTARTGLAGIILDDLYLEFQEDLLRLGQRGSR